ncbi:F-type H+-transporting ATPase subunit delta [Luteimonas sp. J16]|jgi:F-type H+-transporting ATPase subunit delta|uniref:F0F1 ATP synthase subunit delta n=1 Tax=unclassified Luteimonas TaxID=2629088 RepID=UPI00047C779C|nr:MULTISPECIES: F0F1 ATP synthase subunit delta [unclassified Luteimonas]TWG89742.1 F-type H+-transporting ATPase subunit delta [Luteimonas sp. J16]
MSQALTLARPYARAAFMIAKDAGALAEWSSALDFAARIAADPQASQVLGHPALTREQAVALLAPEAAPASFNDFLSLLADNRRIGLLPEIAGLYAGLRADAEQVVKARVTSATALPEAELESIKAALRKRFGREVELETSVDEALIGGAVIAAGDVVIDGSLRGKLARLQAALAQ